MIFLATKSENPDGTFDFHFHVKNAQIKCTNFGKKFILVDVEGKSGIDFSIEGVNLPSKIALKLYIKTPQTMVEKIKSLMLRKRIWNGKPRLK